MYGHNYAFKASIVAYVYSGLFQSTVVTQWQRLKV